MIQYIRQYLPEYDFLPGTIDNLQDQYQLKQGNADFFVKVQNHEATLAECKEDLTACPPEFPQERQNYWLIYENGTCVAILAYLEGYPEKATVYIGLLLVKKELHGRGIGRKINDAFMKAAHQAGYKKIRLGCYLANESGYRFWKRNRYVAEKMTEQENGGKKYPLLHMVCDITDSHMFEPEEERKTVYRAEQEADYHAAENMVRRAFWNKYRPGCDEHYLVHCLRKDAAYVLELSRIAVVDGRIVGGIWYSKATVKTAEGEFEVLTFGPLCVEPEYQGTGVGGRLLRETMQLAKDAGYAGIIIFGEPGYYPKHGFLPCDHYGITTPDGKNFDAFMGIELSKGAFEKMRGGRFFEAKVFEMVPQESVEQFDLNFSEMEKMKLPGQW